MKYNLSTLTLIFLIFSLQLKAQNSSEKQLFNLAAKSTNWFEGFQKNIGDNEFSYSSFRNDVSAALIARATNGKMAIEWETAQIPTNWQQKETGFLWIAALDLTPEKFVFDVFINGKKRFEITTSNKKNWNLETPDGGKLSFLTVETDQHGDAHGYMWLNAPKSWLKTGAAQTIKIVGRANDSNSWIIVYQANDALSYLQNSVDHDVWIDLVLEEIDGKLSGKIHAPVHLSGKKLNYSAGELNKTVQLVENGEISTGTFTLPMSAKYKPFFLNDPKGEVFVVKSLGKDFKSTKLLAKDVLLNESITEGKKIILSAQRNYKPKTVSSLLELSKSNLSSGKIFLMNSSHQDIAWMDTPENCVIERDTMLLTPLFEMAEKDKNYRFDVEDALMLKEYTERHPGKKELVKEMLKDGRISCGSSFTQPYEEMYSGEALARQFYFGAKWLKDGFNYNANVYWNEDVPGRTLQMMQLMRKAGTKYMMISRFERGLYKWYSPNGSYITTFSPGHYSNAFAPLQKNFYEAAQFIATSSLDWQKYYTNKSNSPVIPLLSDWDMSPAKDYSNLIQQWKAIKELQNENGDYVPAQLPGFKIASAPEFFDALMNENPKLKTIAGERPAVWLYIHGPSHQKAIKASREGDILLTQAEKFATANSLVQGSFANYPATRLKNAWESKIYPDHGWGGKHGDITDAFFKQKFEFAKTEATIILNENLVELASQIKTNLQKGRPFVVFNSLNWERSDPVSIEIHFENSQAFNIQLNDFDEKKINIQLNNIENYPDGSIKKATINFIAENIPSIGYKTYYLKALKKINSAKEKKFTKEVENQFYKLKFANGGLASIFDKKLNKEIINSDKFTAGEIFTMHSEGNGAGEFADIQQPDMKGFDKTGNYTTHWEVDESGTVFTTYKYRQQLKDVVVEQKIKLYHQQKRIDFEPALLEWKGVLYREFRMALPLKMNDAKIAYEVPFGVVEVGKDEMKGAAGERYTTICKNIHPRGIENWIGASNTEFGVTMSSSVVAADWIDPTDNPVSYPVLQPVLLASRRSCHWEGNEYLQAGNHYFRFSITSHRPGWKNGAAFGRQANETLKAIWTGNKSPKAELPETMSFFKTNQQNVLISTVKKAEDSNDIIIRMVDLEGKDKTVTFESFKKITKAQRTNLIENDIENLPLTNQKLEFKLGHHSIETIKIK